MHIHEEYAARHTLEVPIVKHYPTGYLFIKNLETDDWVVFSHQWQEVPHRPGNYSLRDWSPAYCHSKSSKDQYLRVRSFDDKMRWHEFEPYILKWVERTRQEVKNRQCRIISSKEEITLSAWEMFVFAKNDYFAGLKSPLVGDLLFGTLNVSLTLKERHQKYEQLIAKLDGALFETWKKDLQTYLDNYSHWLVELINV